jgi:hypothetical protein
LEGGCGDGRMRRGDGGFAFSLLGIGRHWSWSRILNLKSVRHLITVSGMWIPRTHYVMASETLAGEECRRGEGIQAPSHRCDKCHTYPQWHGKENQCNNASSQCLPMLLLLRMIDIDDEHLIS